MPMSCFTCQSNCHDWLSLLTSWQFLFPLLALLEKGNRNQGELQAQPTSSCQDLQNNKLMIIISLTGNLISFFLVVKFERQTVSLWDREISWLLALRYIPVCNKALKLKVCKTSNCKVEKKQPLILISNQPTVVKNKPIIFGTSESI